MRRSNRTITADAAKPMIPIHSLIARIGGTLLNMAAFGAMISYAMQGLSFIHRKDPAAANA